MTSSHLSVFPPRALLSAIHDAPKPIALLVGSPLAMPEAAGSPGVPGVDGVIELVGAAIKRYANDPQAAIADLESQIRESHSARYQCAMDVLVSWTNQNRVNDVVREAVRMARRQPGRESHLSDAERERDNAGWHLPPGVRDLGEMVTKYAGKYSGPILTTNFDPLISVSIERAGGIPAVTVLDTDGKLAVTQTPSIKTHDVVHLHGHWLRGDTLHTRSQLTMPRPQLANSLRSILQNHTLLVVAYGGWDDVFTRELASLVEGNASSVDILWAAFESEPYKIAHYYEPLLARTRDARILNRFRMYGGVDCRTFFGELLAKNHKVPHTGPITPTASAPTPPAVKPARDNDAGERVASTTVALASTAPALPVATKKPRRTKKPQPSGPGFAQRFVRFVAAATLIGAGAAIVSSGALPQFLGSSSPPSVQIPQAPPGSDFVRDIEALRARNRVKELPALQDGARLYDMPERTFGFTPAVALGNIGAATIYRVQPVNSYEIHRLRDGTQFLLAFTGAYVSGAIERGTAATFDVSPIPTTTQTNLVMIPLSRIRSAQLARSIGQLSVRLDVVPAGTRWKSPGAAKPPTAAPAFIIKTPNP